MKNDVSSEEYLGGESEKEDESDEDDEEYDDDSESSENSKEVDRSSENEKEKNKNRNKFSFMKLDDKINHNLTHDEGDTLENIRKICESMLDISK